MGFNSSLNFYYTPSFAVCVYLDTLWQPGHMSAEVGPRLAGWPHFAGTDAWLLNHLKHICVSEHPGESVSPPGAPLTGDPRVRNITSALRFPLSLR